MIKLIFFSILLMNIVLLADENTHVHLIKSVGYSAQNRNKSQSITTYKYDKKNRLDLMSIYMSDYPDMNSSMRYIYNDKNDLIEVISISKIGTPKNPIIQKVSNLFYYSDNKIVKQVSTRNGKIQTETSVVGWKGKMPVKSIMKIYNAQEKLVQLHTYDLDYKDNNIMHQEITSEYLDDNQTIFNTIDIQYAEKKSPEYYVNEGNFYYEPTGYILTKNILKSHSSSKIFRSGTQTYSSEDATIYNTTYDDRGLPVSIEIINDLVAGKDRRYTVYTYGEFNLSK